MMIHQGWWKNHVLSLFHLYLSCIYSLHSLLMHNFPIPSISPFYCPFSVPSYTPVLHIRLILWLCFSSLLTLSHLISLSSLCSLCRSLFFSIPLSLVISAKIENILHFPCVLATVQWVYSEFDGKWLLVICMFSSVQIHQQILYKHVS